MLVDDRSERSGQEDDYLLFLLMVDLKDLDKMITSPFVSLRVCFPKWIDFVFFFFFCLLTIDLEDLYEEMGASRSSLRTFAF